MVTVTRVLLVAALCALSHAQAQERCYWAYLGVMPSEVGSVYTFSEVVDNLETYIQFPLCSCNDFITAVVCSSDPTHLELTRDHNVRLWQPNTVYINKRVHFTSYCSKNHTAPAACA